MVCIACWTSSKNCRFEEGDATNLSGLADQSFNLVASFFGAMFAQAVRRGQGVGARDEFRTYYGPTMNAFAAAERNGKAADLQQELGALFEHENKSGSANATSIPAAYLVVTVTR